MSFNDLVIGESEIFSEVKVFTPSVSEDTRGTIFTTYSKDIYSRFLPKNLEFIHDKFAESKKNVLRGLHGDSKTWKLITCIYGEIFEVVADMREDSPTYMQWESYELNSKNKKQILVPPNFVNGYCVLSDFAVFHYKLAYIGEYFDVAQQKVVKWDDDILKINWPIENPILQTRDK
ncbi:MAG TPA: dTDP-4-dehydrorhamnose 3,5-epimerase family protein [Ignavibacteriaceae bacterium]|nr:dTDP-4-dehydrorhamnose 3,5-epimerase family protein [Ignavibacteriaceae bacterium]